MELFVMYRNTSDKTHHQTRPTIMFRQTNTLRKSLGRVKGRVSFFYEKIVQIGSSGFLLNHPQHPIPHFQTSFYTKLLMTVSSYRYCIIKFCAVFHGSSRRSLGIYKQLDL